VPPVPAVDLALEEHHEQVLTALRRGDLLRLRVSDLKDDGIQVQPHKTAGTSGQRIIIQWTPALRAAVSDCMALRRKVTSIWLFCTRAGQPYIKEDGRANGFDSIWQRFMAKVVAETTVTERFTEHDLRAKCASDAESLEHAQQLLAHTEAATTRRIYRRRGEVVRPLK
jgi:integrase